MPAKSRRGKGKRVAQSRKAMLRSVAGPSQPTTGQIPSATSDVVAPVARVRQPTSIAMSYPYVSAEIRLIGILAVIILVILIVLTLVLP